MSFLNEITLIADIIFFFGALCRAVLHPRSEVISWTVLQTEWANYYTKMVKHPLELGFCGSSFVVV